MDNKKEAQLEANKRWMKKNPDHSKYLRYRSTARTFLRYWAKEEDLQELEELIEERRKMLVENE